MNKSSRESLVGVIGSLALSVSLFFGINDTAHAYYWDCTVHVGEPVKNLFGKRIYHGKQTVNNVEVQADSRSSAESRATYQEFCWTTWGHTRCANSDEYKWVGYSAKCYRQ